MSKLDALRQRPEYAGLDDDTIVQAISLQYPEVPVEKIAADLGVKAAAPPTEGRTVLGTLKDAGITALKGAIGVPEAVVGLMDIPTRGAVGRTLEDAGFRPKEAKSILDEHYSAPQRAAFREVEQAEGFLPTLGAALSNPSVIAHSIGESLPAMGAGGVLGRVAMAASGARVGAAAAGALGEGAMMAGSAAEQIRQQTPDGTLTDTQAGLALATGAAGGALSMLGAKVASKLGLGDIDTALAAGSLNPTAGKGFVRRVLEGALAEGGLEELPQSVMEQVVQNAALGKPLDEGVDHAAVLGLLSGGAMGGGVQMMARREPTAAPAPAVPANAGPLQKAAAAAAVAGATMGTPAAPDANGAAGNVQEAVKTLVAEEQKSAQEHAAGQKDRAINLERQAYEGEQGDAQWDRDAALYADVTGAPALPPGVDATDPDADIPALDAPGQPVVASDFDGKAHEAATSPLNDRPEPTEAQKQAGNYKKGHVKFAGLDLAIENPKGSERKGTRPDGTEWAHTMSNHYGYIKRTEGADGDHVDAYIGPREDAPEVFIVDQVNQQDGSFDEHKVMMGFANRGAAINAYRSNFDKDWKLGRVTAMPVEQFKEWLKTADLKKPASPKGPLNPVNQSAPIDADAGTAPNTNAVTKGATNAAATQPQGAAPSLAQGEPAAAPATGAPAAGPAPVEAGGKGSAPPRHQVGPNPDSWTNSNSQASRDLSDRMGLTGEIEDLFAQGLTAREVRVRMEGKIGNLPMEEHDAFIIGVRATLGIPSRMSEEDHGAFDAWKADYDKRKGTTNAQEQAPADAVGTDGPGAVRADVPAQPVDGPVGVARVDAPAPAPSPAPADAPAPAPAPAPVEAKAEAVHPVGTEAPPAVAGTPSPGADAPPQATDRRVDQAATVAEDSPEARWTRMTSAERIGLLSRTKAKAPEKTARIAWADLSPGWHTKLAKLMDEPATAPAPAPEPKRGTIGMKLAGGEVVLTASGRQTQPFPKVDTSTNGKANNTVLRANRWLIAEALAEAQSRGDQFNERQFQAINNLNPSQADKDSAEEYLFGEQPPVIPSILKPLTGAAPAPAPKPSDLNPSSSPAVNDYLDGKRDTPPTMEEVIAEAPTEEAAAAKNAAAKDDELAAREKAAKAKMLGAAAKLADLLSKNVRLNITPEQEQKLLPIVIELFEGAMDLGYVKFKQAARYVREFLAQAIDQDAADAIPIDTLQGAYIATARRHADKDITPKKDVIAVDSIAELAEDEPAAAPAAAPAPEAAKPASLSEHLAGEIEAGRMPKDNPALRKMVEAFDGEPATPERMKQAQEELEAAIVRVARGIVAKKEGPRSTFAALLRIYESQPNLNVRTSTSVENQAYSTPAPLAFLASELAGIDGKTRVLEPTAGTGMLLMGANVNLARVNELNPARAALLEAQGFAVSTQDAAEGVTRTGGKPVDAVITNPPFGSLKDDAGKTVKVPVDGYKIGQIDHLIAARALESMKPDGRAVLIIGANKVAGGLNEDDRIFFNWLYSNYNVHTHFEVDGKLYARQGAAWPVRVIAINGRKAKPDSALAPREGTIERVYEWEQVYARYEQGLVAGRQSERAPAAGPVGAGEQQAKPGSVPGAAVAAPASTGGRQPAGSAPGDGNVGGGRAGSVGARTDRAPVAVGPDARADGLDGAAPRADRLEQAGDAHGSQAGERPPAAGAGREPARADGNAALSSEENQFQATYVPRSARKDEGVLIPVNMAQPLQDALDVLEDEVGNIDEFARAELGYESVEQMHEGFMGLQVDSVASAIHQIKNGKAIIVADQTGIGKGRQAAAVIRWAIRNGKVPVFVTVKPQLFTDMHEELHGIGSKDVHPFILNVDEPIKDADGGSLYVTKPAERKRAMSQMLSGELPDGRNAVFMTYSQINKENDQRAAIQGIAPRAVFILDESHNAGGDSSTGEFVKGVLDLAQGTVYLSATYAKRPDNMPLYFKTDMGEAVADDDTLMAAMASGGLPLQTVVSNNLVKAGQMFRRERSYAGISIATEADTENRAHHEKLADATTEALRAIVQADRTFHNTYVKELQEQFEEEGAMVQDVAGNQAQQSADHTQFSSVVHNFVRQLLLGLNAQKSADEAVKELKAGNKPIIAVENTMGSFLAEYAENNGIRPGQELGDFTYRTVLSRALERSRYVVIKDRMGNKEKQYIPLSALDPVTQAAYAHAQSVIDNLQVDEIPVSPIDWMRQQIVNAGYTVAELTGRSLKVDYSDPSKPKLDTVSTQEQKDKVATTRAFNSGRLDAIVLNVAGSTGISLHASEKFTDQRPRRMVIAQAAQDINILMQTLGRIHRTGQVVLPGYKFLNPDLPATIRPMALTSKKMKSLNANTSSNTESATSVDAADMMNKYGDEVVAQYLADNRDLAEALGLDIPEQGEEDADTGEGLARKATGRLALMPVAVQKQFYEEVEASYRALLDYLNRTNQNDLEPRTFDFDAREMKSEVIFEGTNPDSPFGQDAVYGEYSVKAQGKPMTPDEIKAAIKDGLGEHESADAHAAQMVRDLTPAFDAFHQGLKEESQQLAAITARDNGFQFLRNYHIGAKMRVSLNGDEYNAIVTGLRNTHKKGGNPYSLSKFQVSIAVNGGLRSVTVPGTKMSGIVISPLARHYTVEQLFSAKAEGRELAKIITGNLLGAYGELSGVKGTIISFTKEDGTTDLGILLPKQFSMASNAKGGYRLRSGADALRVLHSDIRDIDRLGIASRDNVVRIVAARDGGITIRVPKSKSKGGKFFLDKNIRAITGDFVTVGDRMVASVGPDKAAAAIDALSKKQAIYTMPSMAEAAKELLGGNKPAFSQGSAETGAASPKRLVELQELADSIREGWTRKPTVHVVASVAHQDVPQAVRQEARALIAAGGNVPAGVWFDGTVYLFADRIRDDAHAAEVLHHEVLGHMGLRGAFGPRLDGILKQIASARSAEVAAIIRRNGFKPEDRLRAAEELLAEMAQKTPELGFVRRAIAAIKTALRSMGILSADKLSDDEIIRSYILPARAWVTSRDAPGAMSGGPVFSQSSDRARWTADRIDKLVRKYAYGHKPNRTKAYAGWVSPEQFLKATTPPEGRSDLESERTPLDKDRLRDEEQEIYLDGSMAQGGDRFATTGHEGRHRMMALRDAGVKKVPVVFYVSTARDESDSINREVIVAGQKFNVLNNGTGFKVNGLIPITEANRARLQEEFGGSSNIMFSQGEPAGLNNPRDFYAAAMGALRDRTQAPGTLNFWQKTLGTPYDLAQRHPRTFGRVYDAVQTFLRDVSLYATEAADLAPRILPKLDTWRDAFKSALSAQDTQAIQAPIFEGTLAWARDEDGTPIRVEDLEARYAGLDVHERAQLLLRERHITEAELHRWRAMPIETFEGIINPRFEREFTAAGVVWTDAELRERFGLTGERLEDGTYTGQIGLYREARAAIDKSLTQLVLADIVRFGGQRLAPIADQIMEAASLTDASEMARDYLQTLEPTGTAASRELSDKAAKIVAKAQQGQRLIDKGYAPLSRFGTHTLDVVDADGERVYFGLFESRAEAARMARKMKVQFPNATIERGTTSQESHKLFAGMTPETAELFGELLGLEESGDSARDVAFQKFLKEARGTRSAMKRLIHRKGTDGFSEDVGRVLAGFVYSNARQTANSLHAGAISQAVRDIPQGQGEMKDAAVRLMEYVQNPQEEAQAIRGVLFAQYLGGSIASMLVNMTQPFAVTAPYLTQFTSLGRVGSLMKGALADVWKKETGDKALDAALKRAAEEGVVAPQEVHHLMAQAQGKATLAAGDGTALGRAKAMAGNTLSRTAFLWAQPFAIAELFNRRITFIAAYRLAVEKGERDPAAFAKRAIEDTQFIYNKGNKPRWARGAVGATLMTFKQYSISYVELVTRLAQSGPEGRKAAAMMLLMLLLMGGAGGLPFVEDVSDLADGIGQRLGYNTRTKHWREEALKALLGDTLGGFVDKGVTGIPGVPIDVASRFGMGNLIPGTGLATKKQDHTRDVTEILGPGGDFVRRAFEGANLALDGRPVTGALQASPTAARNLAKSAEMALEGHYTDTRGRKVVDVSMADAFWKAVGFQPHTVSRVQEATRDTQQMIGFARLKESEFADKIAKAMFQKDAAAAQSARQEIAAWNRRNPESPIRISAAQINRRVREMRKSKEERVAATAPKEIRSQVQRQLREER